MSFGTSDLFYSMNCHILLYNWMPNKAVHILFSVVIHKRINSKDDPSILHVNQESLTILLKSWFIIATSSDKINIHLTYTKKRLYAVLATVLCHSAHCLRLRDKLSILTDERCSYLKVQTVSKRQVFGNAVFVNNLLTSWLRYGWMYCFFAAQSRRSERWGDTVPEIRPRARGPGQYWRHLPN